VVTRRLDWVLRAVRYSWVFVVSVGSLVALRLVIGSAGLSEGAMWVVVFYAAIITLAVVVGTGFWRRWLFWRRPSREEATRLGNALNLLFAALAALALTELFVFVTTALYTAGHVIADARLPADKVVPLVEQHYVWELSKEAPVLDPEDFGWSEPAKGLTIGGWLAAYKLLVAVPLVGVAKLAYDRQLGNINRDERAGSKRIRRTVRAFEAQSAQASAPEDRSR
jgi:hypothetical protein